MLSINSKINQFKHSPLWEWVKRDFVNKEDNTGFSTFGYPCAIHSNTYWNNQHLNLSTTSLPLRSNIGRFWPEITMNPRIYLRNEQNKWEIALCQMFNNTRERVISPMLKSNFSRSSRDKCDSIPQGTSELFYS